MMPALPFNQYVVLTIAYRYPGWVLNVGLPFWFQTAGTIHPFECYQELGKTSAVATWLISSIPPVLVTYASWPRQTMAAVFV